MELLYMDWAIVLFYEWETKVSGVSAGAKNFILQYGIISLIILVISFSYVVFRVRGLNRHTILVILFSGFLFINRICGTTQPYY